MFSKETIEKFFRQECTSEESASVIEYFQKNPDDLYMYIDENEWNSFIGTEKLKNSVSGKMWKEINTQTKIKPAAVYYFKRMAIAAAVIFAVFSGWLLFHNITKVRPPEISNTKKKSVPKYIFNNGTEKMIIKLDDQSVVGLMPNSSIIYPEFFQPDKRDVKLSGEAYFRISKDNTRPFTVYSNVLATTVLGTHFSVKSFLNDKSIEVILTEGKVMVHSADSAHMVLQKPIYLLPGEKLTFNLATATAVVTSISNKINDPLTSSNKGGLSGNNWYMFNNQSLAEVFDQLQILYNCKIAYSKFDVKELTFIGKIEKTDSLENILNSIALLNNLKITKEGKNYKIVK